MTSIIEQPDVPFLFPLPGGMYSGRWLRFVGVAHRRARHFVIQFQCGPNLDPQDSVALHLDFLFKERCLARNHYERQHNLWGFREHAGALPVRAGDQFFIDVRSDDFSYLVDINGDTFCEFGHRMAPKEVSYLYLDGDVDLEAIEILA